MNKGRIEAFSLLEVMVVLAIMSLMVSILAVSLNRFNEQLKNSTLIQGELNQWYRFRANLWRELYQADSMHYTNTQLDLYDDLKKVSYKIDGDTLFRSAKEADWLSSGFSAASIREENIDENGKRYCFDFNWKGETMTLRFLENESPKEKIDKYFQTF